MDEQDARGDQPLDPQRQHRSTGRAGPSRLPYGYRRLTRRVRDHHGRLRTRHLLSVDEQRAPVVAAIYHWYLHDRLTPTAIARRLAADPNTYPTPINHAHGQPRPWSRRVVAGILQNPTYTGYTVWERTRGGHAQPIRHWVWSIGPSHPALIDATIFKAAHNRRWSSARNLASRNQVAAPHQPPRDVER
ncbi:MAG: recombinase family protein [Haloechinothrix sp.]